MTEASPVKLVPFSPTDYAKWRPESITAYAEEKRVALGVSAEAAREIAERSFSELLPQDLATPDHFLFTAWNDRNEEVGVLWIGYRGEGDRRHLFVYDVVIHERFQGQGLGLGLMQACEQFAREKGSPRISLHVFGHNRRAWKLYEKCGFRVVDIDMEKTL